MIGEDPVPGELILHSVGAFLSVIAIVHSGLHRTDTVEMVKGRGK